MGGKVPTIEIPKKKAKHIKKKAKEGIKEYLPKYQDEYGKIVDADTEKALTSKQCHEQAKAKVKDPNLAKLKKSLGNDIGASFQDEVVEIANEIESVQKLPEMLKKKAAKKAVALLVSAGIEMALKAAGQRIFNEKRGVDEPIEEDSETGDDEQQKDDN
ncbi:hypothetical protein M0811_01609 [Anaeramoeba ignava]|uniref:Uncharacterized protein n=1 Tax=Anaeramoeba ignava TaxID=1746090 RepID=A0A9Q0RA02_ANAIG|nr:hypothetical protein M0811_01609 [Anaeramoeba ignava]|eukprot:Anaeramoba_ignava/a607973_3121.p1 GENE.a607973_3121~~a607973_3121.p1  ORF type:complete len:172 (-),score=77.15 a607973_3121:93-569(-)